MADSPMSQLGVLFVQGVGQRKRGETLIHCADPLEAWLRGWAGSTPERTALSGTRLAPDAEQPAHTRLRLDLAKGGSLDWLLAEAGWGLAARPPNPGAVLKWVGMTGWRVATQQTTRSGREFRGAVGTIGGNWRLMLQSTFPAPVAWVLVWLLYGLTAAILAFAAPVIVIVGAVAFVVAVVLAAALVALAIVPPARPLVRRVQVSVANGIGDPSTLEASATAFDATVTHVRRDLEWLEEHCDAVAVVAHSQGTVIAFDALQRPGGNAKVKLLVTYGPALRLAGRPIDRKDAGDPLKDVNWRDFYAGSDAVAAGPLWPRRTDRRSSEPVENIGSVIGDHFTYWSNAEQFVSAVAGELCGAIGQPLHDRHGDDNRLTDARRDRRQRVTWMVVARTAYIIGAAGVLSSLGPDDLPPLGKFVARVGARLVSFLTRKPVDGSIGGGTVAALAGAAFVVVAAGALYRAIAVTSWSWWSGSAVRDLHEPSRQRASLARAVFALCGLAVPAMAVAGARVAWGQVRWLPFGVVSALLGVVFVAGLGMAVSLAVGRRLASPIPRSLLDGAQVRPKASYALVSWWTLRGFGCCEITALTATNDGRVLYTVDEEAPALRHWWRRQQSVPGRYTKDVHPPMVDVRSLYELDDWRRYHQARESETPAEAT